jgi:hypothetical protein
LQPAQLVTRRFALGDVMKAFGNAAKEGALKIILKNLPERRASHGRTASVPERE